MKWLMRWYNRRRRSLDIDLLWTALIDQANERWPDDAAYALKVAHEVMMEHAAIDDAWADLTAAETRSIIMGLR